MAKASDNVYPKVIVAEGTTPASPAAGQQKLFIDSADHKLKRINSAGTVSTVEGGAYVDPTTTKGDILTRDSSAVARLAVGSNGQVLTADSAQTLGVKWATPSGGGGGSFVYPPGSPDVPPATPNAKDDEFNSTTPSGLWTPTPTAAAVLDLNTTRNLCLYLKSNSANAALQGMYQATPATYPYTILTKLVFRPTGTSPRGGIFVGPAGAVAGTTCFEVAFCNTSIQRFMQQLGGGWISTGGSVALNPNSPAYQWFYLKLTVNSATSITWSASLNGWDYTVGETAINPGFTPGIMGVHVTDESSTGGSFGWFDYFRVS